jgi:hypothetical protein
MVIFPLVSSIDDHRAVLGKLGARSQELGASWGISRNALASGPPFGELVSGIAGLAGTRPGASALRLIRAATSRARELCRETHFWRHNSPVWGVMFLRPPVGLARARGGAIRLRELFLGEGRSSELPKSELARMYSMQMATARQGNS